jgi:hypothetical protein
MGGDGTALLKMEELHRTRACETSRFRKDDRFRAAGAVVLWRRGNCRADFHSARSWGISSNYEVQTDDGQTLLLNEYTKDAAGVRPDGERCHVSFDAGGIAVSTRKRKRSFPRSALEGGEA